MPGDVLGNKIEGGNKKRNQIQAVEWMFLLSRGEMALTGTCQLIATEVVCTKSPTLGRCNYNDLKVGEGIPQQTGVLLKAA